MSVFKVWEILKKFKDSCKFRGWKTSENEDWIEMNEKYHNFLWAKNVHPSSFMNITKNMKCVIREGLSYRVVEASYTAWLFPEAPPENCTRIIFENPEFQKRIALYDLSPLMEGKALCVKLNYTDSQVFHEFENFLKKEMKVKLEHFPRSENYAIADLT